MEANKKKFLQDIYDAAKVASDIDPIFVAAQAALESAYGASKIGKYNIFGVTKGRTWTGKTILVTTHEVFSSPNHKFWPPEKVLSISNMPSKKYRYTVMREFRDYRSLEECIADHSRILKKPIYADAWPYRRNANVFALHLCDAKGAKYATDPSYYKTMSAMIETVKRNVKL